MKTVIIAVLMACAITVQADSHLINISTRGYVGTGEHILIAGCIITGTTPRDIVVRALGPTLQQFGVTDVLFNPTLAFYDSKGTILALNDDWMDDLRASDVIRLGLTPSSQYESAIYCVSVPPGAYTVVVAGRGGTTGVAIVEIYDVTP